MNFSKNITQKVTISVQESRSSKQQNLPNNKINKEKDSDDSEEFWNDCEG